MRMITNRLSLLTSGPFALIYALGLVFSLMGCSTKDHGQESREKHFLDSFFTADSYSKTFYKWTQEKRVHSEFESVMTAYATIWNSEMREAYVRERTREFRLQKADGDLLAKEEADEDLKFVSFILTANTREPNWNDFGYERGLWRLTLENEDGSIQVVPELVVRISDKDEISKYFYKNMNNFGRTYRIRFLRSPLQGLPEATLHIAGPLGSLSFLFKITRPQITGDQEKIQP